MNEQSTSFPEVSGAPPLLLVDVDGVIALFDYASFSPDRGRMVLVDGMPHHLSLAAAESLRAVAARFEMVWCTGWEERADEHLPHLLGLPRGWPHLEFDRSQGPGRSTLGHWKLAAIDAYAGPDRALAWIDDAHDEHCARWAVGRPGPTLLVTTDPVVGMTAAHATALWEWAGALGLRAPPAP
jgi:hypothetical protein